MREHDVDRRCPRGSPAPPARPSSCSGSDTEVRSTRRAGRVSSIPATETRPGTSAPARRRPVSSPIAASSLTASTASGRSPRASSVAAAAAPASYSNPPASRTGSAPAAAIAASKPSSRCALVCRPGGPFDERDPPVAQREQVLGRVPRRPAVVDQHARAVEVARRERDDRRAARLQRVDRVTQRRRLLRVLVATAREDDAGGVIVEQHAEVRELGGRAAIGVADHREVPRPRRDVLHPARDLGEVRIHDVADDHADDPTRALDQRARQLARPVAQLLGRREHAVARRVRHGMRRPVEHARRRGDGHARAAADVGQRRHG